MDPAITPERRERVRELVARYRRTERLLRAGVIVALRGPLVRPNGTTVAVTDADPEAVRDAVAGPYPPMLALVWGRSESVTATPTGGRCEWSFLSGSGARP